MKISFNVSLQDFIILSASNLDFREVKYQFRKQNLILDSFLFYSSRETGKFGY